VVEDVEMPTLAGGREHLLNDAPANVLIFFRPGQDYSRLTLKELAGVEKELAKKPVHWIGVVSDRADKAGVQSEVKETGLSMPVVIDVGDVLYGKLGLAQVPVTVLCDQQHRLVAFQPFMKVNYAAVVRARVRNLLKEISDEELAAVLNPPAALTDSEEAAASRRLKLAAVLFRSKSYDKALENVDASIERSPSAAAYSLRGEILSAQGKCSESVPAFEQALKLEPQNARALQGMKTCQQK
jgi:tetratricopeptide (TPR) repeat protein